MDLNTLAAAVIAQLTRIADAAEAASGATPAGDAAASTTKASTTKAAAAKGPKPAEIRPLMEKAIVAVKDHANGGKDVAVALYKAVGANKMADVKDDQLQGVLDAATAKLAELDAAGGEEEEEGDL